MNRSACDRARRRGARSARLAPAALAAGGSGSAGFGGGGGGGEGGGGGGGGVGVFILIQLRSGSRSRPRARSPRRYRPVSDLAAVHAASCRGPALLVGSGSSGTAQRKKVARRQRRVETAAAVAADEDPAFAPDAVKANASALFKQIQAAWTAGDRAKLSRLVAPDLLVEWERRLDDMDRRGWRNHVEVVGEPTSNTWA